MWNIFIDNSLTNSCVRLYRVSINYGRISLLHNLSRKCCKIVKFVLITHSERNIWNGPIVATAISRDKRKPVLEGNGCLTFCTWPPRSPDLTVCDFFLWGFVKDNVYVPPHSKTLPELRERINTAIGNVTQDMLQRSWDLVGRASQYNSFIDTNLIHNFYINYIKLSSSTCFERRPLIFRRSMMLTLRRRIKSHLLFAGIIRSSPFSPR
jgi:hypothetical protein